MAETLASSAGPRDLESGEIIELNSTTTQPAGPSGRMGADPQPTAPQEVETSQYTALGETKSSPRYISNELLEDKSSLWGFEYKEVSAGHFRWEQTSENLSINSTDVPQLPLIRALAAEPEDVHDQPCFRLVLVEGLSPGVVTSLSSTPLSIPDDFFFHHIEDEPDSRIRSQVEDCFFVKWRRLGTQSLWQWLIDKGIEEGKPYEPDTGIDPQLLQLSHKRFARLPKVYRRCDWLDPCGKALGDLHVSVEESISAFYTKTVSACIAVFIFDPPRQHTITSQIYKKFKRTKDGSRETCPSFKDLSACVDQLKSKLDAGSTHNLSFEDVQKKIEDIVLRQVLRDQMQVLRQINRSLDVVDTKMVDEAALQLYIRNWRVLFAQLRTGLLANSESIASICRHLKTSRGRGTRGDEVQDPYHGLLGPSEFEELRQDINEIRKRQESTFQTLMSTMGILESQRAIQEAKAVTKLTNLAFFFIPLTYVAGICGMNVPAFAAGSLKLWMFAACSVGLLLATYLVLYAQDLFNFTRNFQSYMTRSEISVQALQTLLKMLYWTKRILNLIGVYIIPFLLLVSAVAIPVWLVVTHSTLPAPVKIAVAYLVGAYSLAICLLVTRLFWSRSVVTTLANIAQIIVGNAILAATGVTIWAICTKTSLSHGQKAGASVGAFFAFCLASFPVTITIGLLAGGD